MKYFFQTLIVVILSSPLIAQWSTDPAVNNAISTATGNQLSYSIVSDGSGGAIIVWSDYRGGANCDIYAQKINSSGVVQWTTDGVAISTAVGDQIVPTMVDDGSGGAIITWTDYRGGANCDIYSQKINSSGVVQWTTDGVVISAAAENQIFQTIVSDGSGGAIITWEDYRAVTKTNTYAQKINAAGAVQWTADGLALSTVVSSQNSQKIVSDGSGGAIITWVDSRQTINTDIYAQKITSAGAVQWTVDGVAISRTADFQLNPTIVSDGSGGAIITWEDDRSGMPDIYAQKIQSSGGLYWDTNGVAISTAAGYQTQPTIVSDGSNGAIITWTDERSGTNADIYAQKINSTGFVQWTADGVAISIAPFDQSTHTIISDGSGGAIITWQDNRSGTEDIYAQKINSAGAVQWTANGVAISTAANSQVDPTIVSDGSGGGIISWYDDRSVTNYDVYASQIDANGNLGAGPLPVELTSFSAFTKQHVVELNWNTATELNNYGFEVEKCRIQKSEFRSQNAAEVWNNVGFVEGNGTTNTPKEYSFTDKNISPGKYSYRLKQIDRDGKFEYSQSVEITFGHTPKEFALEQNYPNPFNPSTLISYQIPLNSHVTLKVYDAIGREVAILVNEVKETGYYSVTFNASKLSSGIYFTRLSSNGKSQIKKIMLMK